MKRTAIALIAVLAFSLSLVGQIFTGEAKSSMGRAASISLPQQQFTLSINSIEVVEGDAGTADAVFTVTLSPAAFFDVSVSYATADDTARAGSDYIATSGRLTFPGVETPGNATRTITVPIVGDTNQETIERFRINLSNPSPSEYVGISVSSGICTIVDEDIPPGIVILDTQVAEDDGGGVNAVFRVGVNGASGGDVTVDYATENLSAVAGRDYTAGSGTLTIPAGSVQGNITIPITGDNLPERNEGFIVRLSNARGAPIQDGEAVGVIVDDDAPEQFTVCSSDVPKRIKNDVQGNSTSEIRVERDLTVDDIEVSVFFSRFELLRFYLFEPGRGAVSLDSPAEQNVPLFRITAKGNGFPDQIIPIGSSCSESPDSVFGTSEPTVPDAGSPPYVGRWLSTGLFQHLGINARGTWRISPFLVVPFYEGEGQLECWCLKLTGPRDGLRLDPSRAVIPVIDGIEVELDDPTNPEVLGGHTVAASLNENGRPVAGVPVTFTVRDRAGQGEIILQKAINTNARGRAILFYTDWVPGEQTIEARAEVDGAIYSDIARVTWINPCAATQILQGTAGSEAQLRDMRQFRDSRLARSKRGQQYTRLYYSLSAEAVPLMLLNPWMALRSQQMIERYMPVVRDLASGRDVTLTEGDLDEIDGFLNQFASKGSPRFKQTVKELCQDLRNPEVHQEFGITITPGPRRELPSRGGRLLSLNRTGEIVSLLGFLAGALLLIKRSRRKTLRSLLGVVLALSVISGQWSVAGSGGRGQGAVTAGREKQAASHGGAKASLNNLPVRFEANHGQADPQVRFISRGPGYTLLLKPNEIMMSLSNREATSAQLTPDPRPLTPDLKMSLIGANPDTRVSGIDELPARTSYFTGDDRSKWRAGVPSYSAVEYEGVYPGVDLLYYGNEGRLEYDFKVAPGADPGRIRMAFEGADKIAIDERGDLVISTAAGEIRHRKPLVYQEAEGRRREVASRYSLSDQEVGFSLGEYDRRLPLVIDPVVEYSTYLGGSGIEQGMAISVDAGGNAYIVGTTDSIDLPTVNASQPAFGGGSQDVFVAKLDPTGARLEYLTYLGGSGLDNATGIAVDSAGNAYVTGFTSSTNFPALNALQPNNRGQFNAFVTKLGPTGGILYSTYLGGTTSDAGSGIAVDSAGNAYIAGIATSPNLPVVNAAQANFGGASDLYIAKLNAAGNQLIYSTYIGGSREDAATGIAVDPAGNVYLTGATLSTDFGTVSAAQGEHGGGIFDAFVVKLNPSGNQVLYSTYLGGGGADRGFRIAADSSGNAYVVGDSFSTDFPTVNAMQRNPGGSADAFVAKLNANGSLAYSTYLGGSGIDGATAISVDQTGAAYVTGFTASIDFPVTTPLQQSLGGGESDAFVTKLLPGGTAVEYSTYLGGDESDIGNGIAVGGSDRVYVMGLTGSGTFPTMNPLQAGYGGGLSDVFVAKIRPGPAIAGARIKGQHLMVTGSGFAPGAVILLDGEPQKTKFKNSTTLKGKKVAQKIAPGDTVEVQVRNPDGVESGVFSFRR